MASSEKHVFSSILLSYLSVLAVPVAIGIIIYYSAVSSVTRLVRDFSHNLLNQSVDIMDARLQEMESLPFYLQSIPELISLSNMEAIPSGSPETYHIYETYRRMPKFSLINNMIQNIQVLLLNTDIVISDSSALRMTPQTYSGLFAYTGMTYGEFQVFSKQQVFNNTFMRFYTENKKTSPVVLSSITSPVSGKTSALVIIHLKESSLQDIMTKLLLDESSMAFVLDGNDQLITSVNGAAPSLALSDAMAHISRTASSDSDYGDFIVTTITSSYNGWRYCIFSPRDAVMARMAKTNQTVILLIGFALVMTVLFIFLLGKRKASALKHIVNYLSGKTPEPDSFPDGEFSSIIDAASGLVSSNKQLQLSLQSQKPLLDAAVLRNCLTGGICKPEELNYLFSTLDIKPCGQKFAVVLVCSRVSHVQSHTELVNYPILLSALVREQLEKNVPCPAYFLDINSRQKAILLIQEHISDEIFWKQIQQFAKHTAWLAQEENNILLTFFCSGIYGMVDDLPKAYNEVFVISQHASYTEGQILFSSMDIPTIQKLYCYPIQTELELVRLLKTGSRTELSYFLDNLKNANFMERSLSSSMVQQLVLVIRTSVMRGLSDLPSEQLSSEAFRNLNNAASFEDIVSCLLQLNQYLIQTNNQLNSEKNEKLAALILQYINSHYTDCDLTIIQICDTFHISESLAYQLFREIIGTSFSDLLEQIRIERACQMLSKRTWLIKDIALAVGYTNDNSFRRAFKRVMGVTPGEFNMR